MRRCVTCGELIWRKSVLCVTCQHAQDRWVGKLRHRGVKVEKEQPCVRE